MSFDLEIMISEQQIAERITHLASEINRYYASSDKAFILVGLLRGSCMFIADLCRKLEKAHELDFMTISSYGSGTVSSGEIKILKDLDSEIKDKDVLVIEDIIDSGHTLNAVIEILTARQPHRIDICTLISKPSRREIKVEVRFIGFEIEDQFIVGYGLDYQQKYRHIPYIGRVKNL